MNSIQTQSLPEQLEKVLHSRINNPEAFPRYVLLGRSYQDSSVLWLHEAGKPYLMVIPVAHLAAHKNLLKNTETHDVFREGLLRGFPAFTELQSSITMAINA